MLGKSRKKNVTPEAAAKDNAGSPEKVLSPEEEAAKKAQKKRRRQIREIQSFFTRLVVLAVFLYVLLFVVFGLRPMENDDMKPRVSAGDLLLYYRMEKNFYPDDVVVIEKDGRSYVGRIVALPGDEVEIPEDGGLRINGNSVVESDIFYTTKPYETTAVSYPVKLGSGEYFLLCDYRTGAKDSRFYGVVQEAEISGKVITILRRSNL